ncbi:von Willebrand factor A domain-containing protein 5A-like [Saccostrea echinata]|uniref:von Willebrand factor A domain-containing protein 5A-like n=1 Tax=Saccostrea echinata TaxID=191078 RepID=UPI002A835650|nr:von Willebrand factor A domain-containing protein 5A-like [Saccostrea echinata]
MSRSRYGLTSLTQNRCVPLKKINIQVAIHGFIANVTSDLHYINDSDKNIETEFVFPLDTEAAVYKFEAKIDGRTIVAEVQEKSQAKETYRDAIDSGHTAMYMGEDDNAGDIFRLKLGNLPAKKDAKLTFAYAKELDLSSDNTGTFMLPTVLNPRYAPDCSSNMSKDESNPDESNTTMIKTAESDVGMTYCSNFTMTMEAVVDGGKNLIVSGNKMEFDVVADTIENKMTSSKQLKQGCDFTLVLHYKGFEKPGAVLEKGKEDSGKSFLSTDVLMINFSPEFKDLDTKMPCEFVFVIDRSGSMNGSRIEKAKETLLLLLKSLPVNCIFNVISFGSRFSTLFPKSVEYNEKNLEEALNLQKRMKADMGGTEIFKPLDNVFSNKPSGSYARQVFLLTDGEVWNIPEIIKLVKKQKNTRVFTFGIGDGCSTELIREVAKVSNGKATFLKDSDRLQSKVMSVMKNSVQCGITDVSLTWNLPKGCSVINAPEEVPPIFQGEKLILYAIISGVISKQSSKTQSMKLTGKAGDKNVEYKMDFVLSTSKSDDTDESCPLHRLAAKSRLSEMETNNADERLMVALSTEVNVTCKHTAFVGVDRKSKEIVGKHNDIEYFEEELNEAQLNLSVRSFAAPKLKSAPGIMGKVTNFCSSIFPIKKKKTAVLSRSTNSPVMAMKSAQCSLSADDMMDLDIPDLGDLNLESESAECSCDESDVLEELEDCEELENCEPEKQKEVDHLGKMLELIENQKFDGSWELTEKITKILDKSQDEIKTSAVVQDISVWTTALAIAFLRKYFLKQRDEWEMIEEKALNWLKTRDVEGKDVVQEAMTFLST